MTDNRDYSFETNARNMGSNFAANFEEAFGFTIEEARKDPELVKVLNAQLNRAMWDIGVMPSPF